MFLHKFDGAEWSQGSPVAAILKETDLIHRDEAFSLRGIWIFDSDV